MVYKLVYFHNFYKFFFLTTSALSNKKESQTYILSIRNFKIDAGIIYRFKNLTYIMK